MPVSSAASRPFLSRVALRLSLLAGALLDAATAARWIFVPPVDVTSPNAALSYWLPLSLLLARGAIQALACYDRHRFDSIVPVVAGSHLLMLGAIGSSGVTIAPPVAIGLIQLGSSWRLRR